MPERLDDNLRACLRDHYARTAVSLEPRALGGDTLAQVYHVTDEAGADQPLENSLGHGARDVQPMLQRIPGDHRIRVAHDARDDAADELGATGGVPAIHATHKSNLGACLP